MLHDMTTYAGVQERYTPSGYAALTQTIDPVEEVDGFLVKRGDRFRLGAHSGSKVRQCLRVCERNIHAIRDQHNNGICTGAGLPSPQVAIVAGVARYFGFSCAVTTPRFPNGKRDYSRVNASIAQSEGADVYGVVNPNPSGYERDARCLAETLGYYQVKFGMAGRLAMEPVAEQCENIPDSVETIVVVSGSGLTACGIMWGLRRFERNVSSVIVVRLSGHFGKTAERWYQTLPPEQRFAGDVVCVDSRHKYQSLIKTTPFDWTYESKAWCWMKENIPASRKTLFWVVGEKCYDLNAIREINWKTSQHELLLDAGRAAKRSQKVLPK